MREYELTVIYDLAVTEEGGPEAPEGHLTNQIKARGGEVLSIDHWGRRRMAYPIQHALDGDYVLARVNLDPTTITALEAAFRINERVYRHLIVRADELPKPRIPKEPRVLPGAAEASTGEPAAATTEASEPAAEASEPTAAATEAVATEPVAASAPAPEAVEPVSEAPAAEPVAATTAEVAPAPEAVVEEPAEADSAEGATPAS